MRKYIFLKDDNYSSNLYSNTIEFMQAENLLNISAAESNPYKVKLTTSSEATQMVASNPTLMGCKIVGNPDRISLVSFGGSVYHLDIEKMIELADKDRIASLVSFPQQAFSEAGQLASAELISEQIKDKDFCFIYLTLIKIENTNIYYLVVNHNLVQTISEIDIEEDIEIVQVKDVSNSFKQSVFSIQVDNLFGNVVACYNGFADFNFFTSGLIESPNDSFDMLEFNVTTVNCEFERNECGFRIIKDSVKPAFVKFKVMNRLLDQRIPVEENLEWEYVLMDA